MHKTLHIEVIRMPKSKYATHVEPKLPLIEKWARDGLSHDEIAKNLGINPATLYKYKNEHAELNECLLANRDIANATVVNALYQSCVGFEYQEQVMTPRGDIKEITRYAKPNVAAITLWLKNKMPSEWSDKHEIGLSGEVTTKNEQHYHIIQELVSNPEIAERIRNNFRRGITSGSSP